MLDVLLDKVRFFFIVTVDLTKSIYSTEILTEREDKKGAEREGERSRDRGTEFYSVI